MNKIIADFTQTVGKIKPVNGVGQPPFRGINFSMFEYLKNAHIPFSRLHDVGGPYGGFRFVDIPNLFRDFSADPKNPENYDFAFTDLLITALVEYGIEPIFRLGVSIENYCKVKAYRIYPPEDYNKWAEICEGVIRHYTEGWADGFHYDIKYWEIWNEPDDFEDPMENMMWRGTPEQYYRLYEVASKHLKEKFPNIKIGGYASCGFYAIANSGSDYGACSSRYEYFVEFFDGFLKYIKEKNCPFDFFSWHSYADIRSNVIEANYVRKRLDENGYTNTEQLLDEWNWQPNLKGTVRHASYTAGMMLALQNTPLDSAMFYDAKCGVGIYAGMFNCMTYEPLPAYYSFVAFGELYKRANQVFVGDLPSGVFAVGAKDKDGCLVIANINYDPVNIELDLKGASKITECKIIKEDAVWEDFELQNELPKESVVCIKFEL